jgi:hypothetical protein
MNWSTTWRGEKLMNLFETGNAPKNDPTLMEFVQVTSLGNFCVGGRLVAEGSVVKLPRYVANDLIWQQ